MNIAEIAKMAGVSSAAVSRYFNQGYVSEEKREAIRKVVEETGYRPSVQAQMLRTKKTKMIGVIVPKLASESISRVVEGILSVLNKSGYQMLLAVTQNDPHKEVEYLKAFDRKQVDGVIFSGTVFWKEHHRALKAMKVPVIIVGQQLSGYCCVYHDDYHSVYEMTSRFLQAGRKNVAYLSAVHEDRAAGLERCRGFLDAVRDAGPERAEGNFLISPFSETGAYEKTAELLEKHGNIDGLICATDRMAAGAVQCLRDRGIGVPNQIRVAGHGDSLLARVLQPPLLTVHYFYEKCGAMACEMLLGRIEGKDTEIREIKLGYEIVERKTYLND